MSLDESAKTEVQKVRKLYDLIGERGLYVNSNLDVFSDEPEKVSCGTQYKIPLIEKETRAYSSPLLFATLTSLLNHGTMLLTGAPGVGKTTSAELAGHFFTGTTLNDIISAEIQCNPQLTEEKIVASYDIAKLMNSGEKIIIPSKFMDCPVKILDEVNRMPADIASIIMRLADSGNATYGGQLISSKKGPLFATANYADEGTFQLTPPFLDRFDVAVPVTSPLPQDLRKIRNRGDEKLNGGIEKLLSIPEELKLNFEKIRREINEIRHEETEGISDLEMYSDFVYASLRFSDAASDEITRATKGNIKKTTESCSDHAHFKDCAFNDVSNELSVRTIKAIPRYAKAFAWFNGKEKVELSDLKAILPYLLWHKIIPSANAINQNPKYSNDSISFVRDVLKKIENEYNQIRSSDAIGYWAAALEVLRKEKNGEKEIGYEEERRVIKRAIEKIGELDMPQASVFAYDIACNYNKKYGTSKL